MDGYVRINNEPLPGSRVQIFKNLTRKLGTVTTNSEGPEVAWTETDAIGRFHFKRLAPGRCRVRVSKGGFQDMYFTYVIVSPRQRRGRKLHVEMKLAT